MIPVLFLTTALLVAGVPVAADVPAPADDGAITADGSDTDAARQVVADLLRDHGLSEAQVQQRLTELSDEDVLQLSQHANQIQEGGAPPNYIWILLGALLVVVILTTLF
jgi:membrane-bound lytic murein transglycosylase B